MAGSLLKLTKPLIFIYFCNPWGFFSLDGSGTRAGQAVVTCIISSDKHTALGGIAAGKGTGLGTDGPLCSCRALLNVQGLPIGTHVNPA